MKVQSVAGRRAGMLFNIFSATLLAALIFIPAMSLRAARGDAEVIVASDHTDLGKKYVQPTAAKPLYYYLVSAGPNELGDVIAGEKIPDQKFIEPMVKKALAKQFYYQIDEQHPNADLLIMYTWGSINPDTMDDGGDPSDPSSTTSAGQSALNQQQMLSVVATNKLDLAPNGVDKDLFLPSLSDGRYFILLGGYDYRTLVEGMKAHKSRKDAMLWRTRLSCYNSGAELAAAIPMMLDAANGAFGRDGYPDSKMGKIRQGRVEIGEAQVEAYISDSGKVLDDAGIKRAPKPANAAPANATDQGNAAAKPAASGVSTSGTGAAK